MSLGQPAVAVRVAGRYAGMGYGDPFSLGEEPS
jgi:hypothetical protein